MNTDARHSWFQWVHAGALGVLIAAAGCGPDAKPSAPASSLPLAARVRVVVVENHGLTATEEVVGTVRTRLHATVEAKVAGRIESVRVTPGQRVRQGETLVVLDARETQARLESAKALLEQSVRDLDRLRRLLKDGAATPSEVETMDARNRVAAATVSEAETLLGHARVVAPFDGIVTSKRVDVGDLAIPGKALVEVEDPEHLRFEADVPETLIDQIRIGARLPVHIADRKESIAGTVVEMAPVAEVVSRTYRVKLDLTPAPALRSGQFGRVAVPTAQASVPHVPATAVFQRGQLEYVVVATGGRSQLRLIRTGKHLGDDVQVLSGVEAGEIVVVRDPETLRDGQPVEVAP